MSFIQIFSTFTFYGLDVTALALVTALVTQLVKKTLLARAQKKIVTFLPFILGTLFYAVYAAARNLSLRFLLDEYVSVIEHGFSEIGRAHV